MNLTVTRISTTKQFKVVLFFLILFFFISFNSLAKCYQAISGRNAIVTEIQNGVVCVNCTSFTNGQSITDANENNYASFNAASILGGSGLSVRDSVRTFPAGWRAGYTIDFNTSLLSATIIGSITVSTYDNNVLRETKTSNSGLSVTLIGNNSGRIHVSFPTTLSFDEVRLTFNSAVSLGSYRVYNALAFDPACGVSDNNNICYDQIAGPSTWLTYNGGLANALVSLTGENNITDGNRNSYATLTLPASTPLLSTPPYVGVTEKELVHPAGNRAGFIIGYNSSLLTADVLNTMSIQTYLHGQFQEDAEFAPANSVLKVTALSSGTPDLKELSFTTTMPFNEVRLVVAQTANVNVGSIRIYYAFESGAGCGDAKDLLISSSPVPDNSTLNPSRTGAFGIICLGQNFSGSANVVNTSLTDYATYDPALLSVGCGAAVSVRNNGTDYPAGTFAGFVISKQAGLIDLNLLSAITINVYKDNNAQAAASMSGTSLLNLGLINGNEGLTNIGFKPGTAFDEIQIVFDAGLIGASLGGDYHIYYAYVIRDTDNDGVPDDHDVCSGDDALDSDGDGTPNDCDNCTPTNFKAMYADTDGDGVNDACDSDSDDDGIADAVEDRNNNSYELDDDADRDGISNYLDLDSDDDGIPDLYESGIAQGIVTSIDADQNSVIDAVIARGSNGMATVVESGDSQGAGNNYTLSDKDGDNAPDYVDLDTDNDGINDVLESGYAAVTDNNGDGMADGTDDERDGIQSTADGNTVRGRTPTTSLADTDGDGVLDIADLDSDNDLISDFIESGQPASIDTDNDGLVEGVDSDFDGIVDSIDGDLAFFGDANQGAPQDTDNDGDPNYVDLDSDNDGTNDIVDNGDGWQDLDGDGTVDNPTDPDDDGIANNDGADEQPTDFGGLGQTTLLNVKLLLQGAQASPNDTLMRDDIRQQGLIPLTQPYNTALNARFTQFGNGGGENTLASILSANANTPNAIVDWVLVELRDAATPATIIKTANGFVQRDGDIVGADGNKLGVRIPQGNYYLSVKHRNHLGIMTATPSVVFGTTANIDFRKASTPTYGANARKLTTSGYYVMIGGDVNMNGNVYYTAPGNDRDAMLSTLGGDQFGYLNTYNPTDVNLDAQTYYTAPGNDRDWILSNVLNADEFNYVQEQLP